MAAIDKTYISDWETFDKIRNWAKQQQFTLSNGQVIKLGDYLYYPDVTKKEWEEWSAEYKKEHPEWVFELVLWNTPTYVDVWLIRNCPFDEIQDRLKEQYGGGWSKEAFTDHNDNDMYEQIKNGTSVYDTYKRNGLGRDAHVCFKRLYGSPIRDKKLWWWVTVEKPNNFWYNEETNTWHVDRELLPTNTNTCHFKGTLTKKKVVNIIKNWDLPEGSVVRFEALYKRYLMHTFEAIVTKRKKQ